MGAKGCKGRGGRPHGKEYEGRRHGGGGSGKNKRRRVSAGAVERTHERAERRFAQAEIEAQLQEVKDGEGA